MTAHALIDALAHAGIGRLVVVPASGLERVCDHFETRGRCVFATREEEAVAVAAGLALAGEKPLVLMAQAGVGNALNAVFTLADAYGIWFPIVVCFRGREDPNPVQRVSAERTQRVLDALDCAELTWHDPGALLSLVAKEQRWIRCHV